MEKEKNKFLSIMLIATYIVLTLVYGQVARADECLDCHADKDMVSEEYVIGPASFQRSSHAEIGCLGCHESVSDDHPDTEVITTTRCQMCHDAIEEEYQASVHGQNATCQECHNPHQTRSVGWQSVESGNHSCLECHAEKQNLNYHQRWLPHASLHLAKLPCVTCHTVTSGYQVALSFEKKQAAGLAKTSRPMVMSDLLEEGGVSGLSWIDKDDDGLISRAELKSLQDSAEDQNLRLQVTLVPAEVSHHLTTFDNRFDCTFCHAAGSKSVPSGYITLPVAQEQVGIFPVEQEAVQAVLNAHRNLYITGVTRNASLDMFGLMIIASGFILPVGHGTFRLLTRNRRRHGKDES